MLKILTTGQVAEAVTEAALLRTPEPPASTLLIVRNLQQQLTALEARVAALEAP